MRSMACCEILVPDGVNLNCSAAAAGAESIHRIAAILEIGNELTFSMSCWLPPEA